MTNVDSTGGTPPELIDENNWIEFKILGKETDEPVKNVIVNIKDSKGIKRNRKTTVNGMVRFTYINKGNCDLLELFYDDSKVLETKEEYALQDGDTLKEVANNFEDDELPFMFKNIARHNFGRPDKGKHNKSISLQKIANENMRDDYDCTYYQGGHALYQESNNGKKQIQIPKKLTRQNLATRTTHEIKIPTKKALIELIACQGIPYITFDSNQSFVAPNVKKSIQKLNELLKEHPDAKAMLFGHADLAREDKENKTISENRAKSVYNLLLKKPEPWKDLYREEEWGAKSVQIILNYLKPEAELDITNKYDKRTRKEMNAQGFSISSDGDIEDSTLKNIFQKYMDKLANDINIAEDRFLDLKHTGCAHFNPVINIKGPEEENRRVTFFLFNEDNIPKLPCKQGDLASCTRQTEQHDEAEKKEKGRNINKYERNSRTDYFRCAYYDSLARDCLAETKLPDRIHFDAHMHFMSGNCTPLPVLWSMIKFHSDRSSVQKGWGWWTLKTLTGTHRIVRTGNMPTKQIADQGFKDQKAVYENLYNIAKDRDSKRERLTPLVALSMDMEYAHIDGNKGEPVYTKVLTRKYFKGFRKNDSSKTHGVKTRYIWPKEIKDKVTAQTKTKLYFEGDPLPKGEKAIPEDNGGQGYFYYLDRKSEEANDRVPKWLPDEETKLFKPWDKQVLFTVAATLTHPFDYMPLYHYEPRRWLEEWDKPFDEIATPDNQGANNQGIFIGFKMYTPLGYKPLDQSGDKDLKALKTTLKAFYSKCEQDNIPITNHCSMGGICSHDIDNYFDKDTFSKDEYTRTFWWDRKKAWYYDEFVSPNAWDTQVLTNYKKLKLCLAHFGGGGLWKEWHNSVINSVSSYGRNQRDGYVSSKQKEECRQESIAKWYNKEDHDKPNWIKQIVEIMGKYPNLYTDISYHYIKKCKDEFLWLLKEHPIVKERILFGSDWYMTEADKTSIGDYTGDAKPALEKISKELTKHTGIQENLWMTFTRTNPMKFFGIRGVADNYKAGLQTVLDRYSIAFEAEKIETKGFEIAINHSSVDDKLEIIRDSDIY